MGNNCLFLEMNGNIIAAMGFLIICVVSLGRIKNEYMKKQSLLGKTPLEIKTIVESLKMPKYTANQIAEWIYKKRVSTFDEMTNLSKKHRELLNENFSVGIYNPSVEKKSTDGTIKYLYDTHGGNNVETVFIPEEDRATLCISSQVGCKFGCTFCMTGKMGFKENLTAGEILNQIFSQPNFDLLTNIVFMGMGEPLDNINEVLRTCEILTSEWGLAWSPRRITVSTVGVMANMTKLLEQTQAHVAISLHSPFDEERARLMPVQKANPINGVINLLRKYDWWGQRRLSFEYIMFDGINDTEKHLNGLRMLLKGLHCRVNLIRYHDIPELPYKTTSENKMAYFRDSLTENNIIATIRRSRGQDIEAACGMLSSQKRP